MNIMKAIPSQLDSIINIYQAAIVTMEKNNIFQWDELYPSADLIRLDIQNEELYIGIKNNEIVAVFVINEDYDREYEAGTWNFPHDKFSVVHRLCINPALQKQGLGRRIMLLIEDLLRQQGYQSVRLDAYSLNPYALKLYEGLGYQKTGEVTFRKGLFYLMEKKL